MSLSQSPEFHINVKNPPIYDNSKHYWEQDNDVLQYYAEEKRKFTEGITINGVFIPPWLYFHCNFYTAPIPKDGKDVLQIPGLRDNEWYFAENYEDAKSSNKHLFIMGSRRYSKTTIEGSVVHWTGIIKPYSQSFLMGGSTEDLDMLTKGLRTGMTEMNPAFYMENNSNDWSKHIQLGLKTKSNTPLVYHDIYIRNLEAGQDKKSEKTAGGTPSGFVVDEAAKFACKAMWSAALPSFKTPTGNRCVGILTACVCAGTKVWNNNGDLVNIEDLKPEDGIIGFDVDNQEVSKENITYWQEPYEKECYRIETNTGRYLECSYDHPILKRSPNLVDYRNGRMNGFRKMDFEETQNLVIGDSIGIVQQIDEFGNLEMWSPRLVGLLIGDGSYGFDSTPKLSNCDEDVNSYVYNNFDAVKERGHLTKDGKNYVETRIRKICPELRKIGIYGQTKHKKTLPNNIHSYRKEDICEMIGGFFDADGCVHSIGKNNIVSISSMSKTLMLELQLLLQKFGIHGGVKKKLSSPKSKGENPYYVLTIADKRSLNEFYKNIKFLIKYKQENLERIIKNLEFKKEKIEKRVKNIRFERIVSIESIGSKLVYNLTAGKTNTYVANGIITHNTGGNVNLSQDAVTMLKDPSAYELLAMNWDRLENRIEEKDLITWKRTTFGIFVPGQMGYETGNEKIKTNLKEYLKIKEPSPELEKINIGATDWRLARSIIHTNRTLKKKDKAELDKYTMYHPLDPEEVTIVSHVNPFPAREAQRHKQALIDKGEVGKEVDLIMVGGQIKYQLSDKRPIEDFPFKGGVHDAPVLLFTELPDKLPPRSLNVAGLDPYKQTKSGTESVGAMYILRREGLLNDPMAGCILASYASRPPIPDYFDRTCEYLLDAFNAECLMENADIGFIRYLEQKNKAEFLLANGVDFSKKINPNASANTPYGLYPTPKNQSHLMKGLLNYCNEELIVGFDENNEPIKALGVTRINDIYLLEEIINYKAGGNFDRMVGFAHALAWADYLDMIGVKVESGEQQEKRETLAKHKRSKFFTTTNSKNRWN